MRSFLFDGTEVSVQSAGPKRFGFAALQLSDLSVYPVAAELLMTALDSRAEPWQAHPIEVDETVAEAMVLDLQSSAPPTGVVGPPLLAVFEMGAAEVTVISDNRALEMSFTVLSAEELLGTAAASASGQSEPDHGGNG